MVEDVILNFVGGMLGVILWVKILKVIKKKRKRFPIM
jgi:glycopeptide antibiotics resistance protein